MAPSSKIPLVIIHKSFSLKLVGSDAKALIEKPRPILWCNDGMYCWIPIERVKNAASLAKDAKLAAENNNRTFTLTFFFNWEARILPAHTQQMAEAIMALQETK
jgi:hypothetical protein